MNSVIALGDRAFLARLSDPVAAARWAEAVRARNWPGVTDVVSAYETVGVHADPDVTDLDDLAAWLKQLEPATYASPPRKLVVLPVLYGGDDLPDVARTLRMSETDVVSVHSGRDYLVYAIGFLPGFPYAGDLPGELCGLARRPSPRTRVPAGSVAVVGRQTAVYPGESPGGWHLIGRTPLRVVDVERGHFPIDAGDRLRFVAIGRDEFDARIGELL